MDMIAGRVDQFLDTRLDHFNRWQVRSILADHVDLDHVNRLGQGDYRIADVGGRSEKTFFFAREPHQDHRPLQAPAHCGQRLGRFGHRKT